MKVVIKGTNNVNKGAELMFCAICAEIEKRYPNSSIYISEYKTKSTYKSNNLKILPRKFKSLIYLVNKLHIYGILKRFGINIKMLNASTYCPSKTDIYFDASGYAIGDVWNHNKKSNNNLESFLSNIKKNGTRIIYLPQAFGPFKKQNSQDTANIILKYSDIVYAREEISYKYLKEVCNDKENIRLAPDFTTSVKGVFPIELNEYRDSIIIIPNKRMLMEVGVEIQNYVNLIKLVEKKAQYLDKKIVILNHEGESDLNICNEINRQLNNKYKIINNLSPLEIKGFISSSYAVISSRFHGTASSLSSSVPCLSSSWSPKYKMLYEDYGLSDMIIDLKNDSDIISKLDIILSPEKNQEIRNYLYNKVKTIKDKNNEMWNEIFNKHEI